MIFKAKLRVAGLVLAACSVLAPINVFAASGTVGVSLTFSVAPADLFRAPAIAPQDVRACEAIKLKVDARWSGKARSPALTCGASDAMPLIVTEFNSASLIVRP